MFNSILTTPITLQEFIIALSSSLIMGILLALIFSYKSKTSHSFSLTLAVLPVAMCMITIMINGNLGVAVAVAGGFTLVRFRSIAGNGREISAIFTVMTLGVTCGMGYIAMAAIFFAIVSIVVIALTITHFGEKQNEKLLRITIPENYDYVNLFDNTFKKHNIKAVIDKVKTTNMGSLIDITYKVVLPQNTLSKEALDDIRALNGNLSVMLSSYAIEKEQL